MNALSPSDLPSRKRASLSGCAMSILHLLRMFWLTEAALLLVVLIGLRAGWSTVRQWNDGIFVAAFVQLMVAALRMMNTPMDRTAAAYVRYLFQGDVGETRRQIEVAMLRTQPFAIRALIGSIFTFVISALMLLIK